MGLQVGDYVKVRSTGQVGKIAEGTMLLSNPTLAVVYFGKIDRKVIQEQIKWEDLEKIDPPIQASEVVRRHAEQAGTAYREVVDRTTDLTPDAADDKIAMQSTEESP